jgi:lysyl endopeptidase
MRPTRLLVRGSALLLLAPLAAAQLREPGVPPSARGTLPPEVPSVLLEAGDVRALRAAAEAQQGGKFRYGVELPVGPDGLGVDDAGRWDTLSETGELVWRLELVSPGAHSLGVVFSRFDLPRGAQVFLRNPASGEVLGAYGESTENPNGVLAVQPLRGERVVIEYVEPAGTLTRPALVVGTLVHDFLDVLARVQQGSTLALSCLVDVNCPQGANHQDVKRAVVWMFGGGGGCSGSILNNTSEDGTPYLMTAEHCGNMTNATFVFDYERTGCESGSSSQSKSLSGSTQLAVSPLYDGQLYRINQPIPASYEPFYAGWSVDLDVTRGLGISHPSGFPKKISIDNQPPFLVSTRWSVQWNVGAIQPGSSGSPLFDQDERVVGSLSTGAGGCSQNGQYGRFDLFYATKNLAQWLDPAGWGVGGIDGYDPLEPYTQPYDGAGANPEVFTTVTAPQLGTSWISQVDASAFPLAGSTVLVGHPAPADGPQLGFGRIVVDLGTPRLFQLAAPVSAGLSTHTVPLPNDFALAGLVAYTQAFVLGGGTVATNGLKVVLNP